MSTIVFESNRLRCRRWMPEDFDALFAVYSDPEAMRWVGDGRPISRAECAQWFRITEANYTTRGYGMFTVVERTSGAVVGFAGLVHPGGQPEAEVKYAFLRSHWGLGLASEAVPQLLAYGAAAHGLDRIIATVAPDNVVSQRVLLKAGLILKDQRPGDDGSTTLVFEWVARWASYSWLGELRSAIRPPWSPTYGSPGNSRPETCPWPHIARRVDARWEGARVFGRKLASGLASGGQLVTWSAQRF